MKIKQIFTVLPVLVLLMGCFEETDPRRNRGNEAEVIGHITQAVYDEFKNLGFEMNLGNDPLNVNNLWVDFFPILKATNREVDEIGRRYVDTHLSFQDFDYEELKVFYHESWGEGSWNQGPGLITGRNDKFTVFVDLNFTYEDGEAVHMIKAYSGRIENHQINIYEGALYMIYADESLNFIPNGSARVFENMVQEEEPNSRVIFPLLIK